MDEFEYDQQLRIRTIGILEVRNQIVHYNRYEATPYIALDALFEEYELKKTDEVVDFGCGKGRLPFYVHHKFKVSVTGVEMSGQLYLDALENQSSYMEKHKNMRGFIRFEKGLAEDYSIEVTDNRFYFFNPFSVQIFMKVIDRILQSIVQKNRQVDVILYYPTTDYIQYLENTTMFELLKEVQIPGLYEHNENERFVIYRLEQ
ncbi:MAG: SAM-dependent methyltransferase [Paenisporosarcina sp.]